MKVLPHCLLLSVHMTFCPLLIFLFVSSLTNSLSLYSLSSYLSLSFVSGLSDDAFLLSEPHVTAMFQCLEAVEQNNPKLLAQIDTVGVGLVK